MLRRVLSMTVLLVLWLSGPNLWAQISVPADPSSAFQPANPDPPAPNDAPAAESEAVQAGGSADAGAPEAVEEQAGQLGETAQPPMQPGTGMGGEPPVQQAETPAVVPKETAEPPPPQADKPLSENELSRIYQPHPTAVRVAVLDASGRSEGAGLITFLLEQYRRRELENKIGKLISVVNQSSLMDTKLKNSIISYRPGNLRAALIMADVIPGKQYVKPMVPESTLKIGIDVEIRVGMELP